MYGVFIFIYSMSEVNIKLILALIPFFIHVLVTIFIIAVLCISQLFFVFKAAAKNVMWFAYCIHVTCMYYQNMYIYMLIWMNMSCIHVCSIYTCMKFTVTSMLHACNFHNKAKQTKSWLLSSWSMTPLWRHFF